MSNTKRSLVKGRREEIEKYFLTLIKERSAEEVETFYTYFHDNLHKLFEDHLNKNSSSNPLRAAFIRADPKIFDVLIFTRPIYYSKIQNNDHALKYAVQLGCIRSAARLLLNRNSTELPALVTTNPNLNELLMDFKQLDKGEFSLKYAHQEDNSFFFSDLPVELQCYVLTKLSRGCTFTAPAVCKLWRDSVKPDPIVDNYFVNMKYFECETTLEEYYLKVQLHPTVHHFCLANPKNILPRIDPKYYDADYVRLVDMIVTTAIDDCIDESNKEDLRDLLLNTDVQDIYYWQEYGVTSVYLKIDEDIGIGITMQEPVEGNLKDHHNYLLYPKGQYQPKRIINY